MLQDESTGELRNLLDLKKKRKNGSSSKSEFYKNCALSSKLGKETLHKADVIWSTNIGSADYRIREMKFANVLMDEGTQSTKPENLVPLSKRMRGIRN